MITTRFNLTFLYYEQSNLYTKSNLINNDLDIQLMFLLSEGVNYVWIDGSDEGKEGNWTWNNPMENILLDYWGPNRPDNAGSGQDCMIYRYFSGEYLWDDRECTDNDYPFICDI